MRHIDYISNIIVPLLCHIVLATTLERFSCVLDDDDRSDVDNADDNMMDSIEDDHELSSKLFKVDIFRTSVEAICSAR